MTSKRLRSKSNKFFYCIKFSKCLTLWDYDPWSKTKRKSCCLNLSMWIAQQQRWFYNILVCHAKTELCFFFVGKNVFQNKAWKLILKSLTHVDFVSKIILIPGFTSQIKTYFWKYSKSLINFCPFYFIENWDETKKYNKTINF